MALLDGMGGQPEWVKGILSKRHMGAPINLGAAGGFPEGPFSSLGSVLGGAFGGLGLPLDEGPIGALMGILGKLNSKLGGGGMMGGGTPGAPMPTRPPNVQFDPMSYLQSRLGPGPWAQPPKMPF